MPAAPSEENPCPRCGRKIPPGSRRNLCPACLATSLGAAFFGDNDGEQRGEEKPSSKGPDVPGFELLGLLGEGAAGQVWLAKERSKPHREVAVKILRPELVASDSSVRFEAEMAALAMMDHPGIARVFASGSSSDGRPFFAMEKISGQTICELCDQRDLGVRERLEIFRKLCEAIAHAHRRGIIHRDLKPSNVLATADTADGGTSYSPKVIDFGIAKATENILTEQTLLTRADVVLGTPAYMSPEQAALRGDSVDTRTDIYSLGVLLYELLTGTTPHSHDTLDRLPYHEALEKIRDTTPPRPSTRATDLPHDLDWIVMKALETDPERRYDSASAFAGDIENYLSGEVITARPPTLNYRLRKYIRRHRVPVAAAVAVTIALVAGTIVSVIGFLRAEENATIAERNEERANANARLAEENQARGSETFSGSDFTHARPLLDDRRPALAVAHLSRALRTDPTNRAAATRLLGTLAGENWATSLYEIEGHQGTNRAKFSRDGTKIFTAWYAAASPTKDDPYLRITSATDGKLIHALPLGSDARDFVLSEDEQTLYVINVAAELSVWDIASGSLLRKFTRGLRGSGTQLRLQPGGKRIAIAYYSRNLARVVNLETGAVETTINMPGAGGQFSLIDITSDGRTAVFAHGASLQLFDLASGQPVSPRMVHDNPARGQIIFVAALPDRDRAVSCSADGSARIWDTSTGETLHKFPHESPISTAALSPDGSRLLTGTGTSRGASGFARLFDLENGEMIAEPIRFSGTVTCAAFSPDGSKAAVGARVSRRGDTGVQVIDAWNGAALIAPILHPKGAEVVAFSEDGTQLAFSARHPGTQVYPVRLSAARETQLRLDHAVWRAVLKDESLFTLTAGGIAQSWDARTGKPTSAPQILGPVAVEAYAAVGGDTLHHGFQFRRWIGSFPHTVPWRSVFRTVFPTRFSVGLVHAAAATRDGKVLATGCADGALRIWSLDTGESRFDPLRHGDSPVTAVAFDNDSQRVVSGGANGIVKLWDLSTGQLISECKPHGAEISALAFSPDGETIATGAADGDSRLWWLAQEGKLSPPTNDRVRINHFAFSPDGTVVASSGGDSQVRLRQVRTGEETVKPMVHSDRANFGLFLQWTADGTRIVSSGHAHTAKIWDTATGQLHTRPISHPQSAYAVAYDPNADVLLYASGHVGAWDLQSGEPLTPVTPGTSRYYSASFHPSGRRFVTGDQAHNVSVHDLPVPAGPLPAEAIDLAEAMGGLRYLGTVLEPVDSARLPDLRAEILAGASAVSSDSVANWLRWLATPPEQRTISPESQITPAEHVASLVKQGSIDSLREALHRQPEDPQIMAALGLRLAEQGRRDPCARRYGNFLVARALRLAPADNDVLVVGARLQLANENLSGGLIGFTRALINSPRLETVKVAAQDIYNWGSRRTYELNVLLWELRNDFFSPELRE